MPFEPLAGEAILFPAPFVPTEHQQLVITNKRVVQFAPEGMYPVAEFPIEKIEHVGRMSERPNRLLGIVAVIVGLLFFIVFVAKVLPQVMYAGAPAKTDATADSSDGTEDGIEGRDANDDDPFEANKERKEGVRDQATKRLQKVKAVSFGWPGFTEDVIVGFLFLLGGAVALLVGRSLYGKETHVVFCRVGQVVYPLTVRDAIQQNSILATIQAAQQGLTR
jgi:hypothetical protein